MPNIKSLIKSIRDILHIRRTVEQSCDYYSNIASQNISIKIDSIELLARTQYLRDKTLNAKDQGISEEKYCDHEVVVSLTSYGKRLQEVYLAIESIMQGTMKPNRIVLWLSDDDFRGTSLPLTLQMQQKRGLEVRYCKDIRSYTKLIPSLKLYPDAIVVTIDDDNIYDFDLLENLYNSYVEDSNCISAHRVHKIRFSDDKTIEKYLKWDLNYYQPHTKSPLYFLTGVGGVLYPPRVFNEEVFNESVFLDICPTGDDIWFFSMALFNGVDIKQCFSRSKYGEDFYSESNIASEGLCTINNNLDNSMNDIQIKAVFDRYGITDILKKRGYL